MIRTWIPCLSGEWRQHFQRQTTFVRMSTWSAGSLMWWICVHVPCVSSASHPLSMLLELRRLDYSLLCSNENKCDNDFDLLSFEWLSFNKTEKGVELIDKIILEKRSQVLWNSFGVLWVNNSVIKLNDNPPFQSFILGHSNAFIHFNNN